MKKLSLKVSGVVLASVLVLAGAGCQGTEDVVDRTDIIDRDAIILQAMENGLIMDGVEIDVMKSMTVESHGTTVGNPLSYINQDFSTWSTAALADVTGGNAYGLAYARVNNGQFQLVANMGLLDLPAENYFYEGWIVRRGKDVSVISTGRAVETTEGYINVFTSPEDLTDHAFYVLTLEPDDGDPSPAEHILEGIIK
jgi:hypothetical protein